MSSLKVTPDELAGTAGRIETSIEIADDVRVKHGALQDDASAAGRGDVEGTIRSFMSDWSYGLECVNKDGETLATFLRIASKAYADSEAGIAAAAAQVEAATR